MGIQKETTDLSVQNTRTGDSFVLRIKKGNSASFIEIQEWICKSNPSRKIIHVYVDNSSWHRSKIVRIYQSMMPGIVLEYLPKYSTDLNPVDWEWDELRSTTNQAILFKSRD